MTPRKKSRKKLLLDQREKDGWKNWNNEDHTVKASPEQILRWLDEARAFMSEIWKKNPALKKNYEISRRL